MLQAPTEPITIEAFIAFALLPENAERNLEFVNGEIIEKMPGSTENSGIAANLVFETRLYCQVNELPCFVSTGDGAYRIGQNVIAPDFAYKPTPLTKVYPDPEPPLWVMEVISPHDKVSVSTYDRQIRRNRKYVEAGILLWEINPHEGAIYVYATNQAPPIYGIVYGERDAIAVDVLPGLTIPLPKLFR